MDISYFELAAAGRRRRHKRIFPLDPSRSIHTQVKSQMTSNIRLNLINDVLEQLSFSTEAEQHSIGLESDIDAEEALTVLLNHGSVKEVFFALNDK